MSGDTLSPDPVMRPLAVVTGGSSGIGYAFVKELAGAGYDVIAVARHVEPLEALQTPLLTTTGARLTPLRLDLAVPDSHPALVEAVRAEGRPLALLVNNAGFGTLQAFADAPLEEQVAMLDVNLRAAFVLTRLFLPDLIATKGGIINTASLSAFSPLPYMSTYSATKAFLVSFSRTLHAELKPKGVTVTAVCPGYTRTAFHDRAGVSAVKVPWIVPAQSADQVARQGFAAYQRGKAVVVTGWPNKIAAALSGVLHPVMALVGREANRRVNPDA